MPDIYPEWRRGIKSNLDNTPIEDGNILVTTDTEELYIDIDGKRLKVGSNSVITGYTKEQILAMTDPKKALYLASDKMDLYYYTDKWNKVSSSTGLFGFEIRDDGCLYLVCEDDERADKFYIDANGNLRYKLDGDNVTDVNLGKVTGADGQTYTHPTGSGNNHVPAGGSSDQILRWSADGTAIWGEDKDTTYEKATATADGLMSKEDYNKIRDLDTNLSNMATKVDNLKEDIGGLTFVQDEEGNWGYIAPGADTVTPFKTGDGNGMSLIIGKTPSDVAGTIWFEAESGETISPEAVEGACILSSLIKPEDNTIWCDDGEKLTLMPVLPSKDTGEVGCLWIE